MKSGFVLRVTVAMAAAVTLFGCGGKSGDAARSREETADGAVLDELTGAPGQVRQELDASREAHVRALEDQIEASSDAPAAESADGE